MRLTRGRTFLIGLVAGAAVAAGGTALARESVSVIHGCYKKQNGQLRIVNASATCLSSEKAISWNKQGAQGPQGLPGPAGTAKAYARFVFGSGLDMTRTHGFAAVSTLEPGLYCLTPSTGVDVNSSVAVGAYAVTGKLTTGVSRIPVVHIVYGAADCAPGNLEVQTGGDEPPNGGFFDQHALNGWSVIVP